MSAKAVAERVYGSYFCFLAGGSAMLGESGVVFSVIDVASDIVVVEKKRGSAHVKRSRQLGAAGTSHVKPGFTACESEVTRARAQVSVVTLLLNSYNERRK
jgi:hypothetical protein